MSVNETAVEQAVDSPSVFTVYSEDSESYRHRSLSEVLDVLHSFGNLTAGQAIHIGTATMPSESSFVSADDVIDMAQEKADSDYSEFGVDLTTGVSKEAKAELDAFLDRWTTDHFDVNFWLVDKIYKATITQELIDFYLHAKARQFPNSLINEGLAIYILKAYQVDEEFTLYAAIAPEQAKALYQSDYNLTDDQVKGFDPVELTAEELDKPRAKTDLMGNVVEGTTTIREWLGECKESGFLGGSE